MKLLIIDDERNIRRSVQLILDGEGYECRTAADAKEGLALIPEFAPDLVLLDLLLPDRDGLSVLREIRDQAPRTVVVMISGHGTVQNAMEAVRIGAYDFLEKPVTKEKLLMTVRRGLENLSLHEENRALRREVDDRNRMIGSSPAMRAIAEQIGRVAPTSARVLITGESGVGKELVARAIHEASGLRNGPFVKVNCAAIPEDLIEAELFGSEKGAYTGSVARTDGKFLQADRGTLFLDEIADMSLKAQAKVLRVLQEGEFERVGGHATIRVAVRVLSATNKDLEKEAEAGRFRNDLWYRLNVAPIRVPPLRERREDIPELVGHFISRYCAVNGFRPKTLDPAVLERMRSMDWPGNIRELQNLCERLVIFSGADRIAESDFPFSGPRPGAAQVRARDPFPADMTLREMRERTERDFIVRQLEKTGWNISRTAEILGVERSNLHKKMAAYRIERPDRE